MEPCSPQFGAKKIPLSLFFFLFSFILIRWEKLTCGEEICYIIEILTLSII